MLIRNAEIWSQGVADLRIVGARIAEIGVLACHPGEPLIDAGRGALLPGLHDHHIHLAGLAARASSVACGPPEVSDEAELAAALDQPGNGWLRGIGYHESVMDLPGADALDRLVSHRPLRIQHRSGRMWLFNSRGLEAILANGHAPHGLERSGGQYTGRLFDEDHWLQQALASTPPDFAAASAQLASYGVTGLTDMTPRNDPVIAAYFTAQQASGALVQQCWLAGTLDLAQGRLGTCHLGPAKLHFHEAAMPDFDATVEFIAAAHAQSRGVAIHCTTEVELVFALAALKAAGPQVGDRIEHASIASPTQLRQFAAMGLAICTQPHFVHERGDRYRLDVEPRHQGDLYRLRSIIEAGIPLAGGSDAPFGSADPWQAMASAVSRQTGGGQPFGAGEALSPEQALMLFLCHPERLAEVRTIKIGDPADLCLLDRPWAQARSHLNSADVRTTISAGRVVHDRVDQPPV